MQLDPAARVVQILHHQLGGGHGLPAGVARFPVARAAPDARERRVRQAAVGEFFLNQETNERLVHEGLPGWQFDSQIHRGLDASGANPTRPRCRREDCGRSTRGRLVDQGPPRPGTAVHPTKGWCRQCRPSAASTRGGTRTRRPRWWAPPILSGACRWGRAHGHPHHGDSPGRPFTTRSAQTRTRSRTPRTNASP